MENLLLPIITGMLITGLTQILKRFENINPQFIVLLLCLLAGGFYQLFLIYIPEEMRTQITSFILGSLGTAAVLYEYIWKNLKR